jgi:hypothetical protein
MKLSKDNSRWSTAKSPKIRRLPLAGMICLLCASVGTAFASDTCTDPSVCGQNSGLVPFHKDAIAASLTWKEEAQCPSLLIWMRPSEYKPEQYLNPTVGGVFSDFNETYQRLVQGDLLASIPGFALGRLDESGWSRYAPDLGRENTQLIDVCGLQSVIDANAFTKTSISELTNEDMSRTDHFFRDAGYSRGLGQNLFCAGNVAGADGRVIVLGGHDKGGNNGIRKVSIFNPKTEQWVPRPIPCVKSEFEADPTGATAHCDPLDEVNTDPPTSSDMKYQRWYPTGVTLPDGRILILSGSDQNTSEGGEEASGTKVRQSVPEVYDPKTDTTVALENARKLLPMFPRAFVVQRGKGKDDWQVCTAGEVQPPLPLRPDDPAFGPDVPDLTDYDPFIYNGKTSCLNVLAALADPNRDTPAEHHWTHIDTARNAHDSGATVMKVTINDDGTWAQEVFAFGGSNNQEVAPDGTVVSSPNVATVERINYADSLPRWQEQSSLVQPATQNNAVVLPDGNILLAGGRNGNTNSLHYQMFDPAEGSITQLIDSPVPRHDHSTALLMPNGGVWIMGGNRVDLLPAADRNQAVPVMESYKPPYLFKGPQPSIVEARDMIHYGKSFNLQVSGDVASVVIIRTGPITHNWAWGNQYVKLPFTRGQGRKLIVTAPPLPGLAIPGDYLLFAVSADGVPSTGKHIRLKLAK